MIENDPTDPEKAVLGAMLLNEDVVDLILATLGTRQDVFLNDANSYVFAALVSLHGQYRPLDMVTLTKELQNTGTLGRVGGISYIAGLTDAVPTSANAKHYAEIVKDKHIQRQLAKTMTGLLQKIKSDLCSKEDLAAFQSNISSIFQGCDGGSAVHVSEALKDVLLEIERKRESRVMLDGIPTGIQSLDKIMMGLRPGTLNILAARPSVGKSAFAMNIAYNAAKAGFPVLFFSLETTAASVAKRLLCIDQEVPFSTLCSDFMQHIQEERIAKASISLGNTKIYIDDSSLLDMWKLMSRVKQFNNECDGMPLIIVDYLQLFQTAEKQKNRYEAIGELTRDMKIIAGELGIPFLVLSQLNREANSMDDPEKAMACLRESGNLEQDADTISIMLKNSPDWLSKIAEGKGIKAAHLVNFALVKNRDGETGSIPMNFNKSIQRIIAIEDSVQAETAQVSGSECIESGYVEDDDGELF